MFGPESFLILLAYTTAKMTLQYDHPSGQVRLRVALGQGSPLVSPGLPVSGTKGGDPFALTFSLPQQPCSNLFQARLQKMLYQMPVEYFEASGPLTIDPPIPLANANGNRDMYFQQKAAQYRVECGQAESKIDVIEKKWTGLPPLCACRRELEVTVAVPLCMWGKFDWRRVRDAFTSALVTSATREATKSGMRGQPFIRDIVSRISLFVSERTDAKWL